MYGVGDHCAFAAWATVQFEKSSSSCPLFATTLRSTAWDPKERHCGLWSFFIASWSGCLRLIVPGYPRLEHLKIFAGESGRRQYPGDFSLKPEQAPRGMSGDCLVRGAVHSDGGVAPFHMSGLCVRGRSRWQNSLRPSKASWQRCCLLWSLSPRHCNCTRESCSILTPRCRMYSAGHKLLEYSCFGSTLECLLCARCRNPLSVAKMTILKRNCILG